MLSHQNTVFVNVLHGIKKDCGKYLRSGSFYRLPKIVSFWKDELCSSCKQGEHLIANKIFPYTSLVTVSPYTSLVTDSRKSWVFEKLQTGGPSFCKQDISLWVFPLIQVWLPTLGNRDFLGWTQKKTFLGTVWEKSHDFGGSVTKPV